MAESSGPFDPVDPDNPTPNEILTASAWRRMLEHIVDGVLSPDDLRGYVSQTYARGVTFSAGWALVGGHWYHNDTWLSLISDPNTSSTNRIDRGVLRLDVVAKEVRATLLKGSPGGGIPALTVSETVVDLPLYRWTVAPGASTVTGLTDERIFRGRAVRSCAGDPPTQIRREGDVWYNRNTHKWVGWDGQSTAILGPRDVSSASVSLPFFWEADAPCRVDRRDDMVFLTLNMRWAGTFQSAAQVNGMVIGTIPAAYRPSQRRATTIRIADNMVCQLHVQSNGELELWHPSGTLDSGARLREHFAYLL